MKLRNKITGAIREVPDGTLPRTSSATATNPMQQQDQVATNFPSPGLPDADFGHGILRSLMTTAGQFPLRLLGKLGVSSASDAADKYEEYKRNNPLSSMGKAGETAGDIGMAVAPIPGLDEAGAARLAARFGLSKGLAKAALMGGETARNVGLNQAQRVASTGSVDPTEAGLDAMIGAVPGVFTGLPGVVKNEGIAAVKRGLSIPKKLMKGANPIDVEDALIARKIPFTGGAPRIAAEREAAVEGADAARSALLDKEGVEISYPRIMDATKGRMRGMELSQDLDVGTLAKTGDAEAQAEANFTGAALPKKPFADMKAKGSTGVKLRKLADKAAQYNRITDVVEPPKATFNRIYRDEIENDLLSGVGATPSGTAYAGIKAGLAKDVPLLKAAQDKVATTPSKMGLYMDAALGVGALGAGGVGGMAGGGEGAVAGAAGPLGIIAIRHLLSSPGGGRLLYEFGRGLDNPVTRKGARAGLQLASPPLLGRDQ